MTAPEPLPRGVKIVIALFVAKLIWDIVLIAVRYPEFSYPKLGIAFVLPVILWGMVRGKNWALIFAGVACTFWIAFIIARLAGPIFVIGPIEVPFPWENLVALPAIVLVMNNLKTDEELARS